MSKHKYPLSWPQWLLMLTVALSCGILGTVNYYTSKTTSALRAYVNGESYYSKGQKDASRQLAFYLIDPDIRFYKQFKEDISIPLGDSIARVNMQRGGHIDTIRAGFIQAKNHPDDAEEMIWLFTTFENVSFMAEAIHIWTEADGLVAKLNEMGHEVHADQLRNAMRGEIVADSTSRALQLQRLDEINALTNALTAKEREFSEHMGHTARKITGMLLVANILLILLIVGCSALLSAAMVTRLLRSKAELAQRNNELVETNKRLDHFIYASSHDLKAPINNIQGLLGIMQHDTSEGSRKELIAKIGFSLDSLGHTITDIENLMKADRLGHGDAEPVRFEDVYEKIMIENEVNFRLQDITFHTDFACEGMHYPPLALKSVMQNLISNAVKYRAEDRPAVVRISTKTTAEGIILDVSDNGIGMDLEKHGHKLFGMFKRLHSHVPGSGLGLYAVKQVVEKNGGKIEVQSEVNVGSRFFVIFKVN